MKKLHTMSVSALWERAQNQLRRNCSVRSASSSTLEETAPRTFGTMG